MNSYITAAQDALSNVPYTFFGPTGSQTLIDQFIVTVNISQYVNK